MSETKPVSAQFLDVFVDESGAFRWKTEDKDAIDTETAGESGEIWLSAAFDCYEEPYVTVGFRSEKNKRRSHATIGSTAIYWVNQSGEGYETPFEKIDGLQVEIENDEFGLRRYFIPDSPERPGTVSFWNTELRDNNDPESQGGWSDPNVIQQTDDSLMRQLVINSLQTASEIAA
jgi:hypothetical protein